MEKFTKLEQMVVINALYDYQLTGETKEIKDACMSAKNKLYPILLGQSKEEFGAKAKVIADKLKEELK